MFTVKLVDYIRVSVYTFALEFWITLKEQNLGNEFKKQIL